MAVKEIENESLLMSYAAATMVFIREIIERRDIRTIYLGEESHNAGALIALIDIVLRDYIKDGSTTKERICAEMEKRRIYRCLSVCIDNSLNPGCFKLLKAYRTEVIYGGKAGVTVISDRCAYVLERPYFKRFFIEIDNTRVYQTGRIMVLTEKLDSILHITENKKPRVKSQ